MHQAVQGPQGQARFPGDSDQGRAQETAALEVRGQNRLEQGDRVTNLLLDGDRGDGFGREA